MPPKLSDSTVIRVYRRTNKPQIDNQSYRVYESTSRLSTIKKQLLASFGSQIENGAVENGWPSVVLSDLKMEQFRELPAMVKVWGVLAGESA